MSVIGTAVTAGGLVKSLIQSGDGDALSASKAYSLSFIVPTYSTLWGRSGDRDARHIQRLRVDGAVDGIGIELAELVDVDVRRRQRRLAEVRAVRCGSYRLVRMLICAWSTIGVRLQPADRLPLFAPNAAAGAVRRHGSAPRNPRGRARMWLSLSSINDGLDLSNQLGRMGPWRDPWDSGLVTRYLGPGTWDLGLGTLGLGTWDLGTRTRPQPRPSRR